MQIYKYRNDMRTCARSDSDGGATAATEQAAKRHPAAAALPEQDETSSPPWWMSPIACKGIITRRYSGLATTVPKGTRMGWSCLGNPNGAKLPRPNTS